MTDSNDWLSDPFRGLDLPGKPMPNRKPGQTATQYLRSLTPGQQKRMAYVMKYLGLKNDRWFVLHYIPVQED